MGGIAKETWDAVVSAFDRSHEGVQKVVKIYGQPRIQDSCIPNAISTHKR